MYRRPSGYGWSALTRNQQIAVIVVGVVVILALISGGSSLGRIASPSWLVAAAAIVFIAFPIHEMAHAAMAVALGDPTPRNQGRFTFNPAAHIDPMGALLIFFTGFGWAKPVMWNPRNITIDKRLGAILVALAGPVSNLILAALLLMVLRVFPSAPGTIQGSLLVFWERMIEIFVYINVLLFVFNLIPIPPLDGSHILFALLPGDNFELRMQLGRYGFLLLFLVIFLAPGLIQGPVSAILQALTMLIL